jgi:hypothetical protein
MDRQTTRIARNGTNRLRIVDRAERHERPACIVDRAQRHERPARLIDRLTMSPRHARGH